MIGQDCVDGKCEYGAWCNPSDNKCYEVCGDKWGCSGATVPRKDTYFCNYDACENLTIGDCNILKKGYRKYENSDSPGNDIRQGSKNICTLFDECRYNHNCVGVNNYGWLKNKIVEPLTSQEGVHFYKKMPLDASMPAGQQGGGASEVIQCNPDELLVGVRLNSGNWIDGIRALYCNTLEKIQTGQAPRKVDVNWGSSGPGLSNFQCPKGYALKGYDLYATNWVDGIQFTCKNVVDDTDSSEKHKSPYYGNFHYGSVGGINDRACTTNSFLSGLNARSGNALDQLTGICSDTTSYVNTFNNVQKQLECCAGMKTDPLGCGIWAPGSDRCLQSKREQCSKKEYFFTDACKQLLAPIDRQVQNPSDNTIAQNICAEIKNDPNATDAQKDWCACFNAEVDPETPVVARGIYQCINPGCKGKGLLPYGLTCPSALTICTQKDFTTELTKSEIGRQYIANECGNINIEDPSKPTDPLDPKTKINPFLIGGLAIGAIVLIALLLVLSKIVARLDKLK